MGDLMMTVGGLFFLLVFSFLSFIFIVWFLSLFVKKKGYEHEPPVSILIPAYNEGKNIRHCLESVRKSTYPKEKMELILIDDGSTDDTIKIAKQLGATVITQDHKGKSAALNLGLQHAKHEFVFTLDADTVIEPHCLAELVKPFAEFDVGATTGNSKVKNTNTFVGMFQNVEYNYNNLIRSSFSKLFKNGIWFFGALACYRKDLLLKIGGFKTDTLAEDMDTALEIKTEGFRTVNVQNALGYTIVPSTIRELYTQRARWWIGTLQSLLKNKSLFTKNSSASIKFLFINQFWWSFYAFISLPIIIYQVNYWLPYNSQDLFMLAGYLFRWFTLTGPVYVLYKIPDWGISLYSIFGVLSGIISTIMILAAIRMFKDKSHFKNFFVLIFYFPYTILLNMVIFLSILRCHFWANKYFIK